MKIPINNTGNKTLHKVRSERYKGKGRPRKSDYDYLDEYEYQEYLIRKAKNKMDRMYYEEFSNSFGNQ